MKSIIATRGDGCYMINAGDGEASILMTDTDPPQLFPPKLIDSHMKMGYWEPFEGDAVAVLDALSRAEFQGDESQNVGFEPLRPDPRE